jgi:hypothetical protein
MLPRREEYAMNRAFSRVAALAAGCWVAGLAVHSMAQSAPPQIDIATIGAICSGVSTATLPGGRGEYTEKNGYTFQYNSDKVIEVKQSGVLLYKIEKFTSDDLANCVAKIAMVLSQPRIPEQKSCRDPSNGIERYARDFDVQRNSPEMSGGHSQPEWCGAMTAALRGEHPLGVFSVVTSSESSRSGCAPFNCTLYTYRCTIHVKTDPVYFDKVNPACR